MLMGVAVRLVAGRSLGVRINAAARLFLPKGALGARTLPGRRGSGADSLLPELVFEARAQPAADGVGAGQRRPLPHFSAGPAATTQRCFGVLHLRSCVAGQNSPISSVWSRVPVVKSSGK